MDKREETDVLRPLLSAPLGVQGNSLPRGYKVLRSLTLLALWTCFGLFAEVTGPILPELVAQTSSSYSTIAQVLSMKCAGHAIGGPLGVMVDHWFHHIDILLCLWLLIYTSVSVASAYIQSTPLLYLAFLTQGSAEALLQTASSRITLRAWKKKAAGPLFVLQVGYGLGSLAIPQIVTPFVDPRFSDGTIATGFNSSCRANTTSHTEAPIPQYPAKFVTVYWMLAGYSLIVGLMLFSFHIYGKLTGIRLSIDTKKQQSNFQTLRKSFSFSSCSPTYPRYAAGIIFMLFFYYMMAVPLVRGFSKFIYSYSRNGPCLSVHESVTLETVYFAAATAGRLAAFVMASFIHMKYILQIEVFGALTSALVLCFLHENIWILWTFVIALGFFSGAILPSAFAWANHYIEVTSIAQIVPHIGVAVGDVAVLSALGYSYEEAGPYVLWYYMLVISGCMVIIAGIIQVFGSLHGERDMGDK